MRRHMAKEEPKQLYFDAAFLLKEIRPVVEQLQALIEKVDEFTNRTVDSEVERLHDVLYDRDDSLFDELSNARRSVMGALRRAERLVELGHEAGEREAILDFLGEEAEEE
jgi:hypothetical protein